MFFQQKFILEWKIEHCESIITSLDEYIPQYFDLFWKWQESKMILENWSIFNPNFKVWLRHLTVKESDEKNEFSYTPRNPYDDSKDQFFGKFASCADKISKWVKKLKFFVLVFEQRRLEKIFVCGRCLCYRYVGFF